MATRVIATRLTVDGEAEYKKAMSAVNSELKTLSTEMKLTEAQFKGQANTMEALTAKDEILRNALEKQNHKVTETEKALKAAQKAQSALAEAWDQAKEKAKNAGISLDNLKGNTKGLTEEQKKLVEQLDDAETAYSKISSTVQYHKQSLNRAKTELIKLNGELNDNERYLDEARNSADKCASSIDGFGREVQDSREDVDDLNDELKNLSNGGALGDFMEKLDNLKGVFAGGVVVGGVNALTNAVMDLEESTREYRQVMGTLEVSSLAAGYSADQMMEAYQRLYGVLGDNQATATTLANLQAIGLGQTDLMTIIDQVTGAWATYGDSIPIDSLAESINETIQAGQVTGTFADVLNWAGTNEDEFNEKLEACADKSQRANLVMEEMARQGLAETSEAWRQNNEDIVTMNEAQAELEEAMGRMGELLAPLAAKLVDFGADALGFVIEKLKTAVDLFKKLNRNLNEDAATRMEEGNQRYFDNLDGSHAAGLARVPYDGYVAQLHANEGVLTAQENEVWQSIKAGGLVSRQSAVTAQDLRSTVVAAVNAMGAMQQTRDGETFTGVLTVKTDDGRTLGRYLVPFVREEDKSNPEVVSDSV